MPLDIALLRKILEDVGKKQPGRIERLGRAAAPLKEIRRRAIIFGARIGAVDERADLADAGVPAIGRERAELRIDLVDQRSVIGATRDDESRLGEVERAVELDRKSTRLNSSH